MSPDPTDLDYALLKRLARGDAEALEEFVRRHQQRVYQIAYRLLRDHLESEDAVQEVFLKVYENAHRFEPKAKVSAWLHRITANHCLNLLRRRRPMGSLDQEEGTGPPDPGANPLEVLEEMDLHRRLEELLGELPENQRRAPGPEALRRALLSGDRRSPGTESPGGGRPAEAGPPVP